MTAHVMANGEQNPTGTGRYCPPAICWCGGCAHWRPQPPVDYAAAVGALSRKNAQSASWRDREADTWIDNI